MQLGHVALAATIASYAEPITGWTGVSVSNFSTEALLIAYIAHWLPNLDVLLIWPKIMPDSFHCTWSHSLIFVLLVGLILWPFNVAWAILAVVSLIFHMLADMPSSVGLPLFMPSKKRFTFKLWADTGHSGWFALRSTYEQSWTWILEGATFLFLFVRMYQCQVWPFA